MIDDSDGDRGWLTRGWLALVLLCFAVVFYCIAAFNSQDCAKQTCYYGQTAKLLDHECVCVGTPLNISYK